MSEAPLQQRREIGLADLDRLRALGGHLLHRRLDDGPDRPLGTGVTQQLLEQRDPGALEPLRIENLRVGRRNPALATAGGLIRRVDPDRRIERNRQVADRPRKGSADVLGGGERDDAVAAGQSPGAAQPNQRMVR